MKKHIQSVDNEWRKTRAQIYANYNGSRWTQEISDRNAEIEQEGYTKEDEYIKEKKHIENRLSTARSEFYNFSDLLSKLNGLRREFEDRARKGLFELESLGKQIEDQVILRNTQESHQWGEPILEYISRKNASCVDPNIVASSWVKFLLEKREAIAKTLNAISFTNILACIPQSNDLGVNRSDVERDNSTLKTIIDLYRQKLERFAQMCDFLKTYAMRKAFDENYMAAAASISEKYRELTSL